MGASIAKTEAQTTYYGSPEPNRAKFESSLNSNMFKSPEMTSSTQPKKLQGIEYNQTYESPREEEPHKEEDSDIERASSSSPPPRPMFKPDAKGAFKKDLAGFLESEVFHYKRKKDEEVQALLEEFRNGGVDKSDKEPYKGKFHVYGDSPTRRLICKFSVL